MRGDMSLTCGNADETHEQHFGGVQQNRMDNPLLFV